MWGGEQVWLGTRRFDLRGRLGDGGGGVVYRAFDRALGREVAVKLMHHRDGDEHARFRESFAALQRVAHPNLVQLYDLVQEGERTLIVMELIEGVDLLRYVRHQPSAYDELRVRAAFGQLAQGLDALHREHKVHRDVKPANVRATPQGRIVLLDLDLAVDLDLERRQRALGLPPARPVGTPAYMAPEQAASLRLSAACDWYSMGVVLYEALTGMRPYRGSDLEVLLQKQELPPPPPGELVQGLPRDLERLCVDLVLPDPSQRPSGSEILRRLAVHEDVLSARWTSASLLSARPAFIGREPELARIHEAFERSRSGAVVLWVSGEEGVGKTCLCEEALRRLAASEPQLLVLASACPRYPARPHAPLHEPVARLADALREGQPSMRLSVSASALRLIERAFPGAVVGLEAKTQGRTASAPDPLEQRWRAIAALRAMLAEVAALRPIVFWLDDYHRADQDTQRFVSALVTGPDAPRLLLLLSEEPAPGARLAASALAEERLPLAALSSTEARLLAEALLERAGEPERPLDGALDRGGTPLLVRERVRHAVLFGEPPPATAELSALIARRLAGLPEPARLVLELVCAAFDAIPQAGCEQAAALTPAEFTKQVAALTIAGLVRRKVLPGEDGLAPNHALIADIVDRELQGARRALIHERLASVLAARDATRASGRLLRHQGESEDHGRAADSAELAAEQAHQALAFQRAAELLMLSASLKPPGADARGLRLSRRLAEALAYAGWMVSAAHAYRDAAQLASAGDALTLGQRAFECLLRGGATDEAVEVMRELLAGLGVTLASSTPRALWSLRTQRLLLRLSGLGFRELAERQIPPSELRRLDALFASGAQLSLVDAARGAELSSRALLAARELGEPGRIARALCTEAWNFVGRRWLDRTRAASLLEAARVLTERQDSPLLDGHLRLAHGMVALATYQVRECSVHCRDAERVFRDSCADALWELSMAQAHQLFASSLMAHYRELEPKLALYLREAEERGDVWTQTALLGVDALGLALAADAPERARSRLDEVDSRWGVRDTLHPQALFSLLARGAVDLYQRRPDADERFEQRLAELDQKQFMRTPFVRVAITELKLRTRLLAQVRARDANALRELEADARGLFREREQAASGFGHLLLAGVHALRGDAARVARALEQAILALDPLGLLQWVMPARLLLGRTLGGARGRGVEESAQSQLEQRGVARVERFAAMMLPAFALD